VPVYANTLINVLHAFDTSARGFIAGTWRSYSPLKHPHWERLDAHNQPATYIPNQ
jgi:hypothetical protein